MENNELAFDFAQYTNRSLFLTGKAGTGKTTFLHHLKSSAYKQIAVVAPTGVAAVNAGGTTMHSFFQLPFTPFIPTPEGRKDLIGKMKMQEHRRRVLRELELLVIDEISMVRADLLDAVDTVLRHFRYRNNEPFGGVQVIYIGDMYQLSPVVTDEEWRMLSQYYSGPYFFHSHAVMQQPPVYIEFEKIYRQTNADFIQVLNEIRNDCLTAESLQLLERRYNPSFVPPADDSYITLTTHNYKADRINAEELSKIDGKVFRFEAKVEGDYPEKSQPTERELELKIGAKVMFLRNDTEQPRRYYNGKIGVVEDVADDSIIVRCIDGDETIELERAAWENIRYSANADTKQIEEEVLGSFIQFPLRLAWAITIHKSQGLTFDKAVIDAGDAFAAGQVYVALSRCRSLDGLVLLSKINPQSIQNHHQIVEHQQNKVPVDVLTNELSVSRDLYKKQMLLSLFNFNSINEQSKQFLKQTKEVESSFNDETMPFLENIQQQVQLIDEVARKFQQQLFSIFNVDLVDEDFLQSRLKAASDFFREKIGNLIETLRQSPASTDSRTKAAAYNTEMQILFSEMALKCHIISKMPENISAEYYFELRNTFMQPSFNVSAYAKTPSEKLKPTFPDLYYKLLNERNRLCEPQDLPIYLVAGSATVYEMAEYLPQNEKELLEISGFGPAKVEKYGKPFLDIITEYCQRNDLSSRIDQKESKRKKKEPKEKKEKKAKGETYRISLELFKSGKSIEEIAEARNLAVSTVAGHLTRFVQSGEIPISSFVTEKQCALAEKLLENTDEAGSVYRALSEKFTNIEITMILAWIRGRQK